jgi:hypothetical protein
MRSRGSHEAVDIRTFLLAHPSSSDPYVRLSTLNSGPPKKQSVWPATPDLRRSGRGLGQRERNEQTREGSRASTDMWAGLPAPHVRRPGASARGDSAAQTGWPWHALRGGEGRGPPPRVTSWRGKRSDFVRPFARVGRVGSGRDWCR